MERNPEGEPTPFTVRLTRHGKVGHFTMMHARVQLLGNFKPCTTDICLQLCILCVLALACPIVFRRITRVTTIDMTTARVAWSRSNYGCG